MRKKLFIGTGIFMVLVVLLIASTAVAGAKNNGCTTIQSGELLTSTDQVITTGFDDWDTIIKPINILVITEITKDRRNQLIGVTG